MALADARRRLHDEEPRRGRVGIRLGKRALERVEQPRLLPSRREPLGEVRDETHGRWRGLTVRELDAVTYWFQRDGRRIRKTVRWYLMRPLRKAGEHDHEVDEVLWTDPGDARARLRYESDLKLVNTMGGPEWPPIPPHARGVPGNP